MNAHALGSGELSGYADYRPIAGWRVTLSTDCAGRRTVDLLVDGSFPESLPVVVLRDRPPLNEWPHVEADGKLCIGKDGETLVGSSGAEIGREALIRARKLIDQAASGANREDLRAEALSYWGQALRSGSPRFLSIVEPRGPTRSIVCCQYDKSVLVADDEAQMRVWLRHAQDRRGDTVVISSGVFVCLNEPPLPGEYPSTITELELLLGTRAPEALPLFEQARAGLPDQVAVVLGAPTTNGPCLMGVLIRKGMQPRKLPGRRSKLTLPGFRPGRAPPEVVARYWRGCATMDRSSVQRIDFSWIHGRDRDLRVPDLRGKRVVFLGCGSVGSPIAERIASAGVGSLVLIDPQTLSGSNVGRHELGANDLFKPKASALASRIGQRYPHIKLVRAVCLSWQDAAQANPGLLEDCDLIVSAIGSWADEWALNRWHIGAGRTPSIVYAWTEPHAAAGHAVHVGRRGGCFACGFGPGGVPKCAVTSWPDEGGILPEPGCGGSFSPYGPVELSWVTALASEMVLDVLTAQAPEGLHQVWTAREARIQAAGGHWAESWIVADPARTAGGSIYELAWSPGPCRECGLDGWP